MFQAAQPFQGTFRTPCWLLSFFFHKTCNIYDKVAPLCPRQPVVRCWVAPLLGNGPGAGLGSSSITAPRFFAARPAAPGMAAEETVPFLSCKER